MTHLPVEERRCERTATDWVTRSDWSFRSDSSSYASPPPMSNDIEVLDALTGPFGRVVDIQQK
jgi:hypothetical protein